MDFNKAGPNKRVCAFFIDSILGQVGGVLLSLAIGKNVSWFGWAGYILLKDCTQGQSVGKRLIGIQVIDENNDPANISKTILRNISMIIPVFPLIEYIVMLRDKAEGKRIGDRLVKAKVCDLKPQAQDGVFLWISIVLLIVITVIQVGIVFMLVKQHPELLRK